MFISNHVATFLSDHSSSVFTIKWSPKGKGLITTTSDGSTYLWNISQTGNPTRQPLIEGDISIYHKITPDWIFDGSVFIGINSSGSVNLFSSAGSHISAFSGNYSMIIACPSDSSYLAASVDGPVYLRDLNSVESLKVYEPFPEMPTSICWRDSGFFAMGSADGKVALCSVNGEIDVLPIESQISKKDDQNNEGNGENQNTSADSEPTLHSIVAVSFSPGGAVLAGLTDTILRIWKDGTLLSVLEIQGGTCLGWDGPSNVLVGTEDGYLRVYDTFSGEFRKEIVICKSPIVKIKQNIQNGLIAVGANDGSVTVLKQLEPIVLWFRRSPVTDLDWDETGTQLAISFDEPTATIVSISPYLQ